MNPTLPERVEKARDASGSSPSSLPGTNDVDKAELPARIIDPHRNALTAPKAASCMKDVTFADSTGKSRKFQLCVGSIAFEEVDVIVIAASDDLQFRDSTICPAGGPSIEEQCYAHILKNGRLQNGEIVTLNGGRLKCGNIVLAVTTGATVKRSDLRVALRKSFAECQNKRARSVAISGRLASSCSLTDGILVMLTEIESHLVRQPKTSIETVRLVIDDDLHAPVALEVIREYVNNAKDFSPSAGRRPNWIWQFAGDQGAFQSYLPPDSGRLENFFTKFPTGAFSVQINGAAYAIDLQQKTQTNVMTRKERAIQRVEVSAKSFQFNAIWSFMDDSNRFCPYDPQCSKLIEDALARNQTTVQLKIGNFNYQVDAGNKTQKNLFTSKVRKIRRDLVPEVASSVDAPSSDALTSRSFGSGGGFFRAFFSTSKSLLLPDDDIRILDDGALKEIVTRNNVKMMVQNSHSGNTELQLTGSKKDVNKAASDIQTMIVHQKSMRSTAASKYPQEWQSQTEMVELKRVHLQSNEAKRIEDLMKKSLPDMNIRAIERIQNRWLWDQYDDQRKRMLRKNRQGVNEKELFMARALQTRPKSIKGKKDLTCVSAGKGCGEEATTLPLTPVIRIHMLTGAQMDHIRFSSSKC
eukprot:m.305544 g.305544  ORF g.305544 m.305544 type:complete len:638 (+) comp40863_c0_seq5:418-2331(+)